MIQCSDFQCISNVAYLPRQSTLNLEDKLSREVNHHVTIVCKEKKINKQTKKTCGGNSPML